MSSTEEGGETPPEHFPVVPKHVTCPWCGTRHDRPEGYTEDTLFCSQKCEQESAENEEECKRHTY